VSPYHFSNFNLLPHFTAKKEKDPRKIGCKIEGKKTTEFGSFGGDWRIKS